MGRTNSFGLRKSHGNSKRSKHARRMQACKAKSNDENYDQSNLKPSQEVVTKKRKLRNDKEEEVAADSLLSFSNSASSSTSSDPRKRKERSTPLPKSSKTPYSAFVRLLLKKQEEAAKLVLNNDFKDPAKAMRRVKEYWLGDAVWPREQILTLVKKSNSKRSEFESCHDLERKELLRTEYVEIQEEIGSLILPPEAIQQKHPEVFYAGPSASYHFDTYKKSNGDLLPAEPDWPFNHGLENAPMPNFAHLPRTPTLPEELKGLPLYQQAVSERRMDADSLKQKVKAGYTEVLRSIHVVAEEMQSSVDSAKLIVQFLLNVLQS